MVAKIPDDAWVKQDRYEIQSNGCWNWKGHLGSGGYGRCNNRAGQSLAHRAFYTILKGDIPDGMQLDHLCRNRMCVNPDHLEPVNQKDNQLRGVLARGKPNSTRKDFCRRGHPMKGDNVRYYKNGKYTLRMCVACNHIRNRARAKKPVKDGLVVVTITEMVEF